MNDHSDREQEITEGFRLLGLSGVEDRARFNALETLACVGRPVPPPYGDNDDPQEPQNGDQHA